MYRRGGLYSSFVASGESDDVTENRPYRGAEIAPPKNLNSTGVSNKSRGFNAAAALASMNAAAGTPTGSFNAPTPGFSKHGFVWLDQLKFVTDLTLVLDKNSHPRLIQQSTISLEFS